MRAICPWTAGQRGTSAARAMPNECTRTHSAVPTRHPPRPQTITAPLLSHRHPARCSVEPANKDGNSLGRGTSQRAPPTTWPFRRPLRNTSPLTNSNGAAICQPANPAQSSQPAQSSSPSDGASSPSLLHHARSASRQVCRPSLWSLASVSPISLSLVRPPLAVAPLSPPARSHPVAHLRSSQTRSLRLTARPSAPLSAIAAPIAPRKAVCFAPPRPPWRPYLGEVRLALLALVCPPD